MYYLISVDVPADFLWQLNDPIQINPIETLTQRITDNSPIVKLKDPSSKVSDEFPGLPADRKVHIVVRRPPETQPGEYYDCAPSCPHLPSSTPISCHFPNYFRTPCMDSLLPLGQLFPKLVSNQYQLLCRCFMPPAFLRLKAVC